MSVTSTKELNCLLDLFSIHKRRLIGSQFSFASYQFHSFICRQRRAIKKRIKERQLARLERMKERNDAMPLTPEENSGDSPLTVVTQTPKNNNQIKVMATVHNHTTNGDIITNGAANGHVPNGGIPNGHVIGHLEVETGEINRGEGIPLDTIGEELQDIRVDDTPKAFDSSNKDQNKDTPKAFDTSNKDQKECLDHQAEGSCGQSNIQSNDVISGYGDDVSLVPSSQFMGPISELVNGDLNSSGHLTNGVIIQAHRLSRPLKHSLSEQEACLATTVANVINMRKVFSKRRIKSEELVSAVDFIENEKGIVNHALT